MNEIKANSTRAEDWGRFWRAIKNLDIKDILHTGKNIIVEEARRWGVELRRSKR